MTKPFTLPVRFSPNLHTLWSKAHLGEICVPLTQAAPGDVVAVSLTFANVNGLMSLQPITDFFILGDDDEFMVRQVCPQDLSEETVARIGPAVLRLQSHNPYEGTFSTVADRLQSRAESYLKVLMMPQLAIAVVEEYAELVCSGIHAEKMSQEVVNQCILALHVGFPQSAHETIEMQSSLNQILEIANAEFPMPHPVDFDRDLPLVLPDIASIERL